MEIEIKVPVRSLEPVREALVREGGECLHAMARESNVLFDTADGRIAGRGGALRVRRYGDRAVVTLKGPPRYEGTVKIRREDETEVLDGEAAERILEGLGFAPRVRYEKDREIWRLGAVEVALDHTPMGDFVELEGPQDDLLEKAARLGLDPQSGERGSYVTLWQRYREAHPELDLPEDMVFAR